MDKMQGQEADAVIVSYGVADPEFALREAEFIYGLNRLNVAITRARCQERGVPAAAAAGGVAAGARRGNGGGRARLHAPPGRMDSQHGEELVFEGEDVEAPVLCASGTPR